MKQREIIFKVFLPLVILMSGVCHAEQKRDLEKNIGNYIQGKDARIGVAIIINGKDTVAVNGDKDFPMMSVFKFPLALTVAHFIDLKGSSLNEMTTVSQEDLKENTWSPMLKKYGRETRKMNIRELLGWSLMESDNNAADILLKYVGGPNGMTDLMRIMSISDKITVGASEDDMHRDPFLCYLNRSTPIAMAQLFDQFNRVMKEKTPSLKDIAMMLENCETGKDRLAAPLVGTGAIYGHKTGTGDILEAGRISAINDCGYVNLPDGQYYSIAVFIADSAHDMAEISAIIAEISRIVFESVSTGDNGQSKKS